MSTYCIIRPGLIGPLQGVCEFRVPWAGFNLSPGSLSYELRVAPGRAACGGPTPLKPGDVTVSVHPGGVDGIRRDCEGFGGAWRCRLCGVEGAACAFYCAACSGAAFFVKLKGSERRCSPLSAVVGILCAKRSASLVVGGACEVVRMSVAPCKGEDKPHWLRFGAWVASICPALCCLPYDVGFVLWRTSIAMFFALCPLQGARRSLAPFGLGAVHF